MLASGEITNFISDDELQKVKKVMSSLPKNDTGATYFGSIGEGHQLMSWFEKIFLHKIREFFDPQVKLLFGGYCNEIKPFGIHSDYYHKRVGEPYMAILVPISVDETLEKMHLSKTIIFNQEDTYVDDKSHDQRRNSRKPKDFLTTVLENNSSSMHEEELSHCDQADLERLTIDKVIPWVYGNAIYWDEKKLHCSNNFHKQGINNKQHIIMHTYKEE